MIPKRRMPLFDMLGNLVLFLVKRALGIAVVALAQTEVLMDNRCLTIIPALGEEGNRLAIGDREEDVIRVARNVNTIPFGQVHKGILPGFRVLFDLYAVPIDQQNVFVKLRMTVIPPDFSGLDELVRPFQDGLVRDERENGTAPITDGIEIAGWLKGFDIHFDSQRDRELAIIQQAVMTGPFHNY